MDNSLKGLILAAGVIITCVVVGLGFYISREAKNMSSNGVSQITGMNSEYQDVAKTMYDGLTVSGREVVEVLKKFQDEMEDGTFRITVYTGKAKKENDGSGGTTYGKDGSGTLSAASEKGGAQYINPSARFAGKVTYDGNACIDGLVFSQQ